MSLKTSKKVKFSLIFIFIPVFFACWGDYSRLKAEQILLLDEFDPQVTNLGIFNSFQHHLVLISFTQKNISPFDCHPNRYIFYDYRQEDYFEFSSGNLKISSDYKKLVYTKLHSIVSLSTSDKSEWKEHIQQLLSQMNISALTMEDGKTTSTDKTISCWQQPEVIDLSTKKAQSFPFLVANLCKSAWCSELYWIDSQHVRFWVQINPKELHLIQLNIKTGVYNYKNQTPKYFIKHFAQSNAPRDNLVTEKNTMDGSFTLNAQAGSFIGLRWNLQKNNRIRVNLIRASINQKAGEITRTRIAELTEGKQYTDALRLLKFGFWLSPDNADLKLEKLRVYASLLLVDNFFKSLEEDFSRESRLSACKTLRHDNSLNQIWKQNQFTNRFKELCL